MMNHNTMIALLMLLVLVAACGQQGETGTEQTIATPEVAESPSEPPPLLVDYEAVPTAEGAREELSALRVQDLHGSYAVGINFEGEIREIILIELTTGQESTIESEGLVGQVVLSDEMIAWTSIEVPPASEADEPEMPLYHIFVHDRATGEQKRITEEPAPRYHPVIDGTRLVWVDKRNEMDADYYDTDIYGYDLATDTEYAIAVAPGSQQQASIDGDLVVWQDNRNSEQRSGCSNCADNRFDLYLYDFKDGTSQPIVEGEGNKSSPSISRQHVAWAWYRDSRNADLYLLDLESGEIRRLTQTADSETNPVLSDNYLLWTVKHACDVVEIDADGQEIVYETGAYILDFKTNEVQKLTSYVEPFAWISQNTVLIREACMTVPEVYTVRLE